MLHPSCKSPSIPLGFSPAAYNSGGRFNALARKPAIILRRPMFSLARRTTNFNLHRLLYELLGSLIRLDTHTFVPHVSQRIGGAFATTSLTDQHFSLLPVNSPHPFRNSSVVLYSTCAKLFGQHLSRDLCYTTYHPLRPIITNNTSSPLLPRLLHEVSRAFYSPHRTKAIIDDSQRQPFPSPVTIYVLLFFKAKK